MQKLLRNASEILQKLIVPETFISAGGFSTNKAHFGFDNLQ
jgi:hypothetical protein